MLFRLEPAVTVPAAAASRPSRSISTRPSAIRAPATRPAISRMMLTRTQARARRSFHLAFSAYQRC